MWPLCGSPRMLLLRFQPQFSPVNGSVLLQAFGMKSHPQFDLPRYLSNALSLSIGDVNQRLSCDEGMEDLMNRIVGDEICFSSISRSFLASSNTRSLQPGHKVNRMPWTASSTNIGNFNSVNQSLVHSRIGLTRCCVLFQTRCRRSSVSLMFGLLRVPTMPNDILPPSS